MASSTRKSERERVLYVDFSAPRRELHPALREIDDTATPRAAASSVEAVARLIAENADPRTMDGDLEVICRLLRRYCSWSEESLLRLGRAVATALEHPTASPRRDRPARATPLPPRE